MTAVILADQLLGAGPGTAGEGRNDLWAGREISLTETGVGNVTWAWALLRRPHGSAVVSLTGATTQNATFTPDRQGTYRVRVTTDLGLPSEDTSIKIFRVRYDNSGVLVNRGYVLPAVDEENGESNYEIDNGYGAQENDLEWGEPIDYFMRDVHTRLSTVEAGGGGGGSLVFATLADMAAYNDSSDDDGATASVASLDDEFFIDRADLGTPDGITRIATNSAGGNWVRRGQASVLWQTQEDWFIDGTAGDDEADGATDTTPIKTQAEWRRRTGMRPEVTQTVTFLVTTTEVMIWDLSNTYDNGRVIVRGPELTTLTPVYSGTITSATDWDEVVRQSGNITVSGLPVSFTASGLIDKLCVVTGGAAVGYSFWIDKDLGSKTARVTIATDLAGTYDYAYPAPGDTFEVYDLASLSGQQFVSLKAHSNSLTFSDLYIGNAVDGAHQGRSTLGDPLFERCKVYGWDAKGASAPQFYGCSLHGLRIYDDAEALCFASVHHGTLSVHQGNLVPEWMSQEGGRVVLNEHRSSITPVGYLACFDTDVAIEMGPGSTLDLTEGAIDVWGEGISSAGIVAAAGAQVLLTENYLPEFDAPTFAEIGGFDVTDASPIEAANGACIRHIEQVDYSLVAVNAETAVDAAGSITRKIGTSAEVVEDINSSGYRQRLYDAADALAQTILSLAAQVTHTVVGVYELVAASILLRATGNIALRPDGVGADAHTFAAKSATFDAASTTPVRVGAFHTGAGGYANNGAIYFGGAPSTTNYTFLGNQSQSVLNCPDRSGNVYLEHGGFPTLRVIPDATKTLWSFYDNQDGGGVVGATLSINTASEVLWTPAAGVGFGVRATQMTGDAASAPALGWKGADASATATNAGSPNRRKGGPIWFEAGRAGVDGGATASGYEPGPIYFGFGAQSSDFALTTGIVMGYGAGVGTPGTPGYVPFTTSLGSIRAQADTWTFEGSRPISIRCQSVSHDMLLMAGGNMALTSSGSFAQTSIGPATLYSSSSFLQLAAAGVVNIYSGTRTVEFGHYADGVCRVRPRWAADVAIASTPSVYTTLLTLAISGAAGARPVTIRGVMHAWSAAGATVCQSFEVRMRPNGGTGAMVGSETIDSPEGDVLGTLVIDVSSGCRFRFFADASLAAALTGCITDLEFS